MPSSEQRPRTVRAVGRDAWLIECRDTMDASAVAAWVRSHADDRVIDVVPAMQTVLVVSDRRRSLEAAATVRAAAAADVTQGDVPAPAQVRLDVTYDGDDLARCASELGIGTDTLIRAHQQAHWQVAFIGFAPGFAYLTAPDWPYRLPRLSDPRPRVPVGSVGIADGFSGVYPSPSPGGWQLIGRTATRIWDPEREPPTLLPPGAHVTFVQVRP